LAPIATGLMGLDLEPAVRTLPRITAATQWAELDGVPIRANELNIRHDGIAKMTVANSKGPPVTWRACFPGSFSALLVDGQTVAVKQRKRPAHSRSRVRRSTFGSGDRRIAQAPTINQ
jgi:hypothetical protein